MRRRARLSSTSTPTSTRSCGRRRRNPCRPSSTISEPEHNGRSRRSCHRCPSHSERLPVTNSSDLRSAYDITAAARAVQPVLREFSGFGDRHRRTADEVIEALEENGMFRLFTPRRFGGLEIDLATLLSVTTALGEADGSAAWLVGVAASTSWLMAHGSPELQEEVRS
ncbi:acyl-CoA dehydrogenase family protein [Mycolicibacterium murale]|uniref:acyl-CoA dehydrogenase family protein n=1 Tax=Mycolicibacterium murale TaxID=182220 RepID=UPI001FE3A21E|nr:acyl-CoA dehydrogenase family protein [Mycolicibacterium murale]